MGEKHRIEAGRLSSVRAEQDKTQRLVFTGKPFQSLWNQTLVFTGKVFYSLWNLPFNTESRVIVSLWHTLFWGTVAVKESVIGEEKLKRIRDTLVYWLCKMCSSGADIVHDGSITCMRLINRSTEAFPYTTFKNGETKERQWC